MFFRCIGAVALLTAAQLSAATVTVHSGFNGVGFDGRVQVNINPPNGGHSHLDLSWDLMTNELSNTGGNLGQRVLWYITPDSGAFDIAYLETHDPFGRNTGNGSVILGDFGSIYLCAWIDLGPFDSNQVPRSDEQPGPGDLFVWTRIGFGLVLEDYGVDRTGQGIFVGTQQSVPEPSIPVLFGISVVPVFWKRRR